MKIRARYFATIQEAEEAFEKLGCDFAGIKIMNTKAVFHSFHVIDISIKAAIILKQEMMALGGEVVLPREVMTLQPTTTSALTLGTAKQHKKLTQKLYQQPFGCKAIAEKIQKAIAIESKEITWQARDKTLQLNQPIIMGVVNITPDSFSDGGKFYDPDAAIQQCKKLAAEGAHILDLGAESSRPGSDPVSAEEELQRILPVLDAIMKDPEITALISIDTYKPEVAAACLERGAHIINDISGLQNKQMQELVAKYDVPVIIMHMQGNPKTMQNNPTYTDVVDDIIDFMEQQILLCEQKGIKKIICDPGIGFGKTVQNNLDILRRLKEFQILGKPILIGTSRKSFINKTVGGTPEDRLEGTIASNVIAAMNGAQIFRVHNVKACKRALDLTEHIMRKSGRRP